MEDNDLRRTIELEKAVITRLEAENKRLENELETWRKKYNEGEKRFEEGKIASRRITLLEVENKALKDRVRHMMSQSMNMSSASSIIDNRVPPPPPPVDVPSVDEFLKMSAEQQYGNMGMNSSIPPPPPVEAPLSDLLLQRSGNRSVNGSYG